MRGSLSTSGSQYRACLLRGTGQLPSGSQEEHHRSGPTSKAQKPEPMEGVPTIECGRRVALRVPGPPWGSTATLVISAAVVISPPDRRKNTTEVVPRRQQGEGGRGERKTMRK